MSQTPDDSHLVYDTGDHNGDRVRRSMAPSLSPHVLPERGTMDTPPLEPAMAQFSQMLAESQVFTQQSLLMEQATSIFTRTLPFRQHIIPADSPQLLPFPGPSLPSEAETDRFQQLPRDSPSSSTNSGSNFNSPTPQHSDPFSESRSLSSHSPQPQTQLQLAINNLRSAQATAEMTIPRPSFPGSSQQYLSPYVPQNGNTPAHYVPQHPASAPPPPQQNDQQVERNSTNPRNEFIVSAHYRLEASGHLLGTGIINAVPAANGDILFPRVVALVNRQASDLARDSYGLASAMAEFAVTIPATPFSPAKRRTLQFSRLAIRYEFTVTMEDSDAEPYDTKIKNTEELTMGLRMMALRDFRDVLVVYFALGEPVVIEDEKAEIEMDSGTGDGGGEVKGKRTRGGGVLGRAKKARNA